MGCCRGANRGIFAINELPRPGQQGAGRLVQRPSRGDVQIKGYPVRLPLDVDNVLSQIRRTTRGKDHRRSRTASDRKCAPRTRRHARQRTAGGLDEPDHPACGMADVPIEVPDFIAGRSRKSRSRRGRTRGRSPVERPSVVDHALENVVSNAGGAPPCAEPVVVTPRQRSVRIAAGAHRENRTGVRRRTQRR